MPTPQSKPSASQLKITILGIESAIWRRILVPNTIPLCCVHDAFKAALG
jgi:hypothetical protein